MEHFGNRVRRRRLELGITQEELARRLGYSSRSAVNKIERCVNDVPQSRVQALAAALETTAAYLMGWEDFWGRGLEPLPEKKRIPLLGAIACGEPILAAENIEDEVFVPESLNADFALRCKGDSMTGARIFDGDIVYIRQQPDVENGEIAAVLIHDEATLKRLKKGDGKLVLWPENPDYEPLVFIGSEADQVQIIGKAVAFTSLIR